ncbi:GcrA cell cycle regulator [Beijerinckiaceae bacterium RH AL1]|jgi:GcrA cell cycle regulator|nr:GcrA cell cycle regulator [Beijerinckiaceae bacterium]VVB48723.1 GcrA cell cycle regulator [Beijerinckiaceae bacterium RH CH11]VVB48804.1 GcrA cell cycle regulator [Beijerinckiaceae bacterium RH AL8]VVC56536.1 GcrA cell cycle regulator [Beijerinckiaceae bacterium RH AL1]
MTDQNAANGAVLPWSEERVELLRKLWEDGLSASRIAAELAGGVTRNAVIGKVHRLGLSGRVKAQSTASTARARPKTQGLVRPQGTPQRPTMPQMRGNTALAMQARPMPMPARDVGGDNVVPLAENVTIMELRESMCRWPVGDPASAEFRYCGGKAPIGEGPYCAYHSRMAYQPMQDRRQRRSA